jgi:hypothetical protein
MTFRPDVEELIRKRTVVKPEEEFVLPPLPPDPPVDPQTQRTSYAAEVEEPTLFEQLVQEAEEVEELLRIIEDTAEEVSVPVSLEEEQLLVGERITARDYLETFRGAGNQHDMLRRDRFERGILSTPGEDRHWSILAYPDLVGIREELLLAARTFEGRELVEQGFANPATSGKLQQELARSQLAEIARATIDASRNQRSLFVQATNTFRAQLPNALLQHLISPLVGKNLEKSRQNLLDLLQALTLFRSLLSHAQLLRTFRYFHFRQHLFSLVEQKALEHLSQAALAILHRVNSELVRPVLGVLERSINGTPLLELLTDTGSQVVVGAMTDALDDLTGRFNDLAAELLQGVEERRSKRLEKLQQLGERSTVGRWIAHLDRAIGIVRAALNTSQITSSLAQGLSEQIMARLDPAPTRLAKRLEEHVLYGQVVLRDFFFALPPIGLPLNESFVPSPVDTSHGSGISPR